MIADSTNFATSPEFYPIHLNLKRRLISFVRMSPESYSQSSFLDHRALSVDNRIYDASLDDLLLWVQQSPAHPNPLHYILHPAFCCSTLLARCLDLMPRCFVLKEPHLLTQLSLGRPPGIEFADGGMKTSAHRDWFELVELCLALLNRAYAPTDIIVLKANDRCNALGRLLLNRDERSKVVFLSTSLRSFLLAVLKSRERRLWLRERLNPAQKDALCFPALANLNPEVLPDAEAAAYLWTVNAAVRRRLCRYIEESRVIILDGDRIPEAPSAAVRRVAEHLGISSDQQRIRDVEDHPSMNRHAKEPGKVYNAATREKEILVLEEEWGREADGGMDWVARHEPVLLGDECTTNELNT